MIIDWDECAVEYDRCRQRISALLTADDAGVAVPTCPAWNVSDVCAHLAGVPASLCSGRRPGPDVQAWVDDDVAGRRGRSIDSLLDEWASVTPEFQGQMIAQGGRVAGLLLDVIAHEHDLRHALGRPGARASRGVVLSMGFERLLLRGDVDRLGRGSVLARSVDGEWSAGAGDPAVALDLTGHPNGTWELFRLLGSRRSARQVDGYRWSSPWRAMRDGLFHMALPDNDIVE